MQGPPCNTIEDKLRVFLIAWHQCLHCMHFNFVLMLQDWFHLLPLFFGMHDNDKEIKLYLGIWHYRKISVHGRKNLSVCISVNGPLAYLRAVLPIIGRMELENDKSNLDAEDQC